MIAAEAKSYAIRKLRFHMAMTALMIILFIGSWVLINQGEVQATLFDSTFKQASSKAGELNRARIRSEDDMKLWNNGLNMIYQSRSGLNLDLAKKKLENLKLSNRITNLSVGLSNPDLRRDIKDLQYTNIEYSILNVGFAAYTDKDALRFVNQLTKELPGVMAYISYDMEGEMEINESLLSTSRLKDAQIKPIIRGKLQVMWQNLLDINVAKDKHAAAATAAAAPAPAAAPTANTNANPGGTQK